MMTVEKITQGISAMVDNVCEKMSIAPRTAVVLGSGLGSFADSVENAVRISYSEIPGYPVSGVEGHAGELVAGSVDTVPVLLASGRFHLYEGYNKETITLPVRLFHGLGIENLIITNAAGSANSDFPPGTLMASVGHLDCTFRESADMPEVERGSEYHSPELLKVASEVSQTEQVGLERGVYAWTLGPSFETPAEVRMVQDLGGDAVGMSTVPEIRLAGKLGMEVLTISCLTNYAAGMSDQPLTHDEVMETANRISDDFARLVRGIICGIGN